MSISFTDLYTNVHTYTQVFAALVCSFFFKENRMNTGKDKKGSHFFHFPARFRILHS